MQMFRPLAFAILLVPLILTGILPVEAAVLRGTITVDNLSGGLAGRTFLGDFTYDDSQLTRNGLETMGVNPGGDNDFDIGGFKSFSFNFVDVQTSTMPVLYTQSDANKFDEFGAIVFRNGLPIQLVGIAFNQGVADFFFAINGDFLYQLGGIQPNGKANSGAGRVNLTVEPNAVPFDFKPILPICIIFGFLFLLRYRNKKKLS